MSPLSPAQLYARLQALTRDQLREICVRVEHARDIPQDTPAATCNGLVDWVGANPANQRRLLEAVRAVCGMHDPDAWLATQWRDRRWLRPLGLRTGDGRPQILLTELFVDLELSHRGRGLADPLAGREAGLFGPARADEAARQAQDLDAALAALEADGHNRRVVVLVGAPGSGKTTLLAHRFVHAFNPPGDEGAAPTLKAGGRRPVPLRCSSLDRHGLTPTLVRGELVRWVEVAAREDAHPGAGQALVADRSGPYLFLLDGYDELTSHPLSDPEPDGPATSRERFSRWLAREVDLWPNSLFVLTTRKAAWEGDRHGALDERAAEYALLGLTVPARDQYVRRYFPKVAESEVHGRSEPELARLRQRAGELAEHLLHHIIEAQGTPENDRVARLTGNPLLLSIVCLVFRGHGRLPQRRGDLYGKCYEVLVRGNRESDPDPTGGHARRGFEPDVGVRLLGPLAWEMQAAAHDLESAKELPREQVLAVLHRTRDADPSTRGTSPDELLTTLVRQTGLLLEPDPHTVIFAHLTFQEFLAAEHARLPPGRAAWLGERAMEPRWREPILLGQADQGFQEAFYRALLARPGALAAVGELALASAREREPPAGPMVDLFLRAGASESPAPAPPAPSLWARLWGRQPAAAPPPPRPPTSADLAVALGLFSGAPPEQVAAAARPLLGHPDAHVRALTARLLGEEPPATGPIWRVISGLELELVPVKAGSFLMGASKAEGPGHDPDAFDREGPPHLVTLSRDLWLGRFPVTNAQYLRYVDAVPGARAPDSFRTEGRDDPQMPVTGVSWEEAEAFCAWASSLGAGTVRLPTEAEWEWAARGSEGRRYPWGRQPSPSLERAWYGGYGWDPDKREWRQELGEHTRTVKGPAPVGGRPLGAAPCGAEELAGNVWEWCLDGWRDDYRDDTDGVVDPCAPAAPGRVVRGGAWYLVSRCLRCSDRGRIPSEVRGGYLGFRVVCVPPPEPR